MSGTSLVQQASEGQGKSVGFANVTTSNLPRRISINPTEERVTTLIGETGLFRGEMVLQEGIKIDGVFEGDLEFGTEDGLCIVAKSGQVIGTIKGPKALIMGTIQGDVEISGTVVIAHTAKILGHLRYGKLVVYEGANIEGSMHKIVTGQQYEASNPKSTHQADIVPLQRQVAG